MIQNHQALTTLQAMRTVTKIKKKCGTYGHKAVEIKQITTTRLDKNNIY
jgi:hypothetical protein